MTKSFKTSTLTFILFITSFKALQSNIPNTPPSPSTWQVFITLIFGNPKQQPQNNPHQAPAGVTEDDYIAQFRSDLNGHQNIPVIPWNEVYEMEAALRIELCNINLRDKDKVNQKIRSVLCNQVRIGAIRDLNESKQKGFYVTSNDYETIPNSYEGNVIARLHRMPHLNGEAIAQYFGEARKHAIQNSLPKRNQNSTHYY